MSYDLMYESMIICQTQLLKPAKVAQFTYRSLPPEGAHSTFFDWQEPDELN